MSSSKKRSGKYIIGCDTRGCGQHISSVLGQSRAMEMAAERGWYVASERVAKGRKNHPALCPDHNNTEGVKR